MGNKGSDCDLQFASGKRRLLAFLLDFSVVTGYILFLLAIGIGISLLGYKPQLLETPAGLNVISFGILVLPVMLYFSLQEGSRRQATWGKRRQRIKVITTLGGEPGFWRSMWRSFVKFLPWNLAHVCVISLSFGNESPIYLIGAIAAQGLAVVYVAGLWIGKKHRTVYDWLLGTCVVEEE